jgi:hypothetical protein
MDMTEPKVCKITMAGFVTELMAECTDISGTADTPSTATSSRSAHCALLGERAKGSTHWWPSSSTSASAVDRTY